MTPKKPKTYRILQVEYAPGMHLVLSIISGFVLLKHGIILFLFSLILPAFLSHTNRSFVETFNAKPVLWFVLGLLYFSSTVLPKILYTFFYHEPLIKFFSTTLIPTGSIFISLFIWKFYNEDTLKKSGWKNIIGKR